VSPDGEVFEHTVSTNLIRQFVQGLKRIRLRGYQR
jgi:hypothetical protein